MPLTEMSHCSIRTLKMEETREFYAGILDLKSGDRPDFDFPGYWMYLGDLAVIHIVGVDPDNPQGLIDYLGDVDMDDLEGSSGAFDHIAFTCVDPQDMLTRIKAKGYEYRERQVPNMDLYQIFLEDPNGITVELNYFGETGGY